MHYEPRIRGLLYSMTQGLVLPHKTSADGMHLPSPSRALATLDSEC